MIRMPRFNSELELTLEKLFFFLVSNLRLWKNGNKDVMSLSHRGSDQDWPGYVC